MSLDDFKDNNDNPLKEDPEEEDKWRYEEPDIPEWERYVRDDEKQDGESSRLILSITNSQIKFISDMSEAWISAKEYLELKLWR